MPRIVPVIAIIMALAGAAMLFLGGHRNAPGPAPASPPYSLSQNFSAGELSTSVPYTLDHEFTFRNDSDKPIDLIDVKPACGCTSWEAPIRHFEPGETGSVKINLTLNGSGPASSSATLTWSTGEKTDVMLAAQALVPREMYLSAYSIDTGVNTPASFSLIYIDQNGVEPPAVVWNVNGPAVVQIGEWKRLTPDTANGRIAARYMATGSVTVTGPLTDVIRITLSLPDSGLRDSELVVRTPEFVELHRNDRPLSQPIAAAAPTPVDAGK